ncbi:MAG: DUF6391 domain-containing protein, partial [Nostoc sp.]
MNTSASFQGGSSPLEFFKFDFKTPVSEKVPSLEDRFSDFPQPTQDADLLRQLSFIPGLKEILMLRQVHALEHATVWVL